MSVRPLPLALDSQTRQMGQRRSNTPSIQLSVGQLQMAQNLPPTPHSYSWPPAILKVTIPENVRYGS